MIIDIQIHLYEASSNNFHLLKSYAATKERMDIQTYGRIQGNTPCIQPLCGGGINRIDPVKMDSQVTLIYQCGTYLKNQRYMAKVGRKFGLPVIILDLMDPHLHFFN